MGASFSFQSNVSKQITNDYMKVVSAVTNSAVTTAGLKQISVNSIKLTTCAPGTIAKPICGPRDLNCGKVEGNININQISKSAFTMSAETYQKAVTTAATNLKDKTVDFIKSQTSAEQSAWLNIAFGIQINDSTQVENFAASISTFIRNTAKADCSGINFSEDSIVLNLCGFTGGDLNIGQNNVSIAVQSCVTKQISKSIMTNTIFREGIAKADASAFASQQGAFAGIFNIIIAIIVVIGILIIIAVFAHIFRKRKPKRVLYDQQDYQDPYEYPGQPSYGINQSPYDPQGPAARSPYGSQGPAARSPYDPQGSVAGSLYGPQGPAARSPYGSQGPAARSPYGPQGPAARSPYVHQRPTERSPYEHQRPESRSPYEHHRPTSRSPYEHQRPASRSPYEHHRPTSRSPYEHHRPATQRHMPHRRPGTRSRFQVPRGERKLISRGNLSRLYTEAEPLAAAAI